MAKGYFGGNEVENLMAKIRHLSEIQQEIAFTEFDFYQRYAETFKTSELGRIKSLLPLRQMAISFNLMEERPMHKRVKRGRKSFFTPEGKVALAFLKMYTGLSAPKLMEALNGNIDRGRSTMTLKKRTWPTGSSAGTNEVKNATKRELARVRATAMEGSFGTQKEHYGLRKIAARIKSTEIMLIFFVIHTANVVNLARRESIQLPLTA